MDGAIPAKETLKDNKEFNERLKEFNDKHKSNPACDKCAKLAFERGRFTDFSKFQTMEKKRVTKAILEKHQGNTTYGKMVDWKCKDGHGVSIQYEPGESDDKNEVSK